jgi:hypothetical protein
MASVAELLFFVNTKRPAILARIPMDELRIEGGVIRTDDRKLDVKFITVSTSPKATIK